MTAETRRKPRLIAIHNHKGGVGKTTTAINLATVLAAAGQKVVLMDLDPQGNVSAGLGLGPVGTRATSYDLLFSGRTVPELTRETSVPNLWVVPASLDLAGTDLELANADRPQYRLKDTLAAGLPDCDTMVFDCPPSFGMIVMNALVAADLVLIPVQCESFALEGLLQIQRTIKQVKSRLNPGLNYRIVLTLFDADHEISRAVVAEARAHFGGRVLATTIPAESRVTEATFHGKPVSVYDPECDGAKAYARLARELMEWEAEGGMADHMYTTLGKLAEDYWDNPPAERRLGESDYTEPPALGWEQTLSNGGGEVTPAPRRAGVWMLAALVGVLAAAAAGFWWAAQAGLRF